MLPDGRRLHLSHGPIDLIVQAFGAAREVEAAYARASARFNEILPTLVKELPLLRAPLGEDRPLVSGSVATRMVAACWPHRALFLTPMAAVAGAVADEMLAALVAGGDLDKAYVNNGGDIAFHLSPGASLTAGLVADYHMPALDATCALGAEQPTRGLATSGWKGRSFSLGVADSVTVLAGTAAAADVAATLIANAVNIDHPAIIRAPARFLDPDSDLGDRSVTTDVGTLDEATVRAALENGLVRAHAAERGGHIQAAVLVLQGHFRVAGAVPAGLIAGNTHSGTERTG
ncbi:MAG: UPF0280 family protein [Alphaproteobacteria bacterium]